MKHSYTCNHIRVPVFWQTFPLAKTKLWCDSLSSPALPLSPCLKNQKKSLFSQIVDAVLQSESTLYSDILQLDETESDHLFPLRIPAGLAWLEQTCSTSIPTFVAKASTTVFVHRDALLQQLDSLPSGIHSQNDEIDE